MSELTDLLEGKRYLVDAFTALKGKDIEASPAEEAHFTPLEAREDYLVVEITDSFNAGARTYTLQGCCPSTHPLSSTLRKSIGRPTRQGTEGGRGETMRIHEAKPSPRYVGRKPRTKPMARATCSFLKGFTR